ncbi:MAG: hypothetical protein ABW034_05610 [Steroidobacteraceae bacterium]
MLEDVKLRATGRLIANYALPHQLAAKHFAARVKDIEIANRHQPFGEFWNDIRTYVTGTILSSASAMEAFINECFLLPNGELRNRISNFEAEFWGRNGIERLSILAKYNHALRLLDKPELKDIDGAALAHAQALVGLRNTLVHFKPLYDAPRDTQLELEQNLRACSFPLSQYHGAESDFVLQCMSSGCADWAVRTSADLVRVFADQTRIQTNVAEAFQ